jgi:hypothetical protein
LAGCRGNGIRFVEGPLPPQIQIEGGGGGGAQCGTFI